MPGATATVSDALLPATTVALVGCVLITGAMFTETTALLLVTEDEVAFSVFVTTTV
jgi:hypothetical protein